MPTRSGTLGLETQSQVSHSKSRRYDFPLNEIVGAGCPSLYRVLEPGRSDRVIVKVIGLCLYNSNILCLTECTAPPHHHHRVQQTANAKQRAYKGKGVGELEKISFHRSKNEKVTVISIDDGSEPVSSATVVEQQQPPASVVPGSEGGGDSDVVEMVSIHEERKDTCGSSSGGGAGISSSSSGNGGVIEIDGSDGAESKTSAVSTQPTQLPASAAAT